MTIQRITIQPDRDALIIVDQQLDFQPGGALPVAGGDTMAQGIDSFAGNFIEVILTQDHHPRGHVSFASSYRNREAYTTISLAEAEGGEVVLSEHAAFTMPALLACLAEARGAMQMLWPDHCIIGSEGERIDPRIDAARATLVLRKGYRPNADSYSAFRENDGLTTGLAELLMSRGIDRVFVCGLNGHSSVFRTADDAAAAGLEVVYLEDLTCFVGVPDDARETAYRRMKETGVKIVNSPAVALPSQKVGM